MLFFTHNSRALHVGLVQLWCALPIFAALLQTPGPAPKGTLVNETPHVYCWPPAPFDTQGFIFGAVDDPESIYLVTTRFSPMPVAEPVVWLIGHPYVPHPSQMPWPGTCIRRDGVSRIGAPYLHVGGSGVSTTWARMERSRVPHSELVGSTWIVCAIMVHEELGEIVTQNKVFTVQ